MIKGGNFVRIKYMKITLCGSVKFADKLVEIYKKLEEMGHEPKMHEGMFRVADGTAPEIEEIKNGAEDSDIKKKYGYIKWWHNSIINSDAVLICNFDKNNIKNYVGGNTLIEMGFAHVSDKKVFLLNFMPEGLSYVEEIKAMTDVVLNGDLNKINES